MNKIFISIMVLSLCIIGVSGAPDDPDTTVLRYEFEESAGSIIIDSSGNGFHGVDVGVNEFTNPVRWGLRSADFDGGSDYITVDTLPANTISSNNSVSWWIYPSTSPVNTIEIQWLIDDIITPSLETGIWINSVNDDIVFFYTDTGLVQHSEVIGSGLINRGNWNHIVVNLNLIGNYVELYHNGMFITQHNLSNQIYTTPGTIKNVWIGSDIGGFINEYDGQMDEFRAFASLINESQVTDLFLNNNIEFPFNVEPPEFNQTTAEDIIIFQSPDQDELVTNPVEIDVVVSQKSDCDIYVDNELAGSFTETNGFGFEAVLERGDHNYFVYCSNIDEGVLKYELTNSTGFEVVAGSPSIVNFHITGSDYNVAEENLYIVTPCLKYVQSIGDFGNGATDEINKRNNEAFYFQKVVDEVATFNVESTTHEFCLVNGLVQYSENNFTTSFNVNNLYGVVEIGDIDVPSNVTESYTIQTELIDIYDFTDPRAHGTNWSAIIGGLVLLFMGGLTMLAGVASKNGRIVIAGALMCILAMGIEFTGILGMVI